MLATAWALFSGPTRYISLATVAFFGIGAYTVAVLGEMLPWPLVLADRSGARRHRGRAVVGLSTLRLRGVYFVIFTFGLTELIRQLVIWYEINKSRGSAATSSSTSPRPTSTGSCWRSSAAGVPARLADRAARGSALRCA